MARPGFLTNMIDPQVVAGWLVAFGTSAYALWQTNSANKAKKELTQVAVSAASNSPSSEDLARMNAELAAAYKDQAAKWQLAYETEKSDTEKYRKYVHDKNEVDAATMLSLSNENAQLKAQTNLSPLIQLVENQTRTTDQVLTVLAKMEEALDHIIHRLPADPAI